MINDFRESDYNFYKFIESKEFQCHDCKNFKLVELSVSKYDLIDIIRKITDNIRNNYPQREVYASIAFVKHFCTSCHTDNCFRTISNPQTFCDGIVCDYFKSYKEHLEEQKNKEHLEELRKKQKELESKLNQIKEQKLLRRFDKNIWKQKPKRR